MPTYDYQNVETGEKIERIFLVGEETPKEFELDGQRYVRCVSGFRIGSPRVRTWERTLTATDRRPFEPGTERDIKRAKEYRVAQQDAERTEIIADTVREFDV